MNRRRAFFQQCDANPAHQSLAGCASWAAFSARWRARQGLPLLHPLHVQYLTPHDFCNGLGHPLPPAQQRRLFRQYVAAAVQAALREELAWRLRGCRAPGVGSADLALVRARGFVQWRGPRQPDFLYGRQDVMPYEPDGLLPRRPYGIPVTSPAFQPYWLAPGCGPEADGDGNGDESWIAPVGDKAGDGVDACSSHEEACE